MTHAVKEIGLTAVKTGSIMAMQQVVGMIVVETIDIFMDEISLSPKSLIFLMKKELVGNVKELN